MWFRFLLANFGLPQLERFIVQRLSDSRTFQHFVVRSNKRVEDVVSSVRSGELADSVKPRIENVKRAIVDTWKEETTKRP